MINIDKTKWPLCFSTTIDSTYEQYLPIFLYTLLREEYHSAIIYHRGKLSDACKGIIETYCGDKNRYRIIENAWPEYFQHKRTTATLRFLAPREDFEGHPYVFFHDVDMLLFRDSVIPIALKHHEVMKIRGLEHYENYCIQAYDKTGNHSLGQRTERTSDAKRNEEDTEPVPTYRMPGVHFIEKEWFYIVERARNEYRNILKTETKLRYGYDELMLYQIHKKSGLKLTYKGHENWRWHAAVHFKNFRETRNIPNFDKPTYFFFVSLHKEPNYKGLLSECRKHYSGINMLYSKIEQILDICRKYHRLDDTLM